MMTRICEWMSRYTRMVKYVRESMYTYVLYVSPVKVDKIGGGDDDA